MRLRPALGFLVLSLALTGHARGAAPGVDDRGAPEAAAAPVATRQNAFTIPFRIEPTQNASQQPLEVQLHVSMDGGRTWELASRVAPDKESFVFRAPHDGQYSFAIRTVDRQGVARPDTLVSQLQVVVDTVAPRLDLTATRGEAGELVARWQAVDPNLRPQSFKLEYQTEPGGPWQSVAVDSAPSAMRYTLSGETTWWPRLAGSNSLTVRAEITDAAGNPAANQAVVQIGQTAGPVAEEPPPPGEPTLANSDWPGATRWPADRATSDPLARAADNRGGASRPNLEPPSDDAAWRGSQYARGTPGSRPPTTAVPVSQTRAARPVIDFSLLPSGERARMVAARNFELEYEIDSVGPSGIAKVELWGTTDGGRSWLLFGVDTDNQSPVPVRVDTEGLYGFRMVVESGSGLGGQPPAAGDLPDIWIGVDLSRPTVRVLGVDVSPDASEMVIRWEASDDVPDVRPISLAYSTAPGGPWTPIASGLENMGSYRWRLEERMPPRIYVRLEARDEAGNVGVFELPEPVTLDRSRPEGHIRGVRSPAATPK